MRWIAFLPLLALTAVPAQGQTRYEVSFPNLVHHEAEITVTVPRTGNGPTLFQMSRSSPGRYALHEFAKNVYRVSAKDSRGRALEIERPDPYSWAVLGGQGEITLTYTLFGDRGDGTYAQIDTTHAHLNMPATFMWVRGQENRPFQVTFHPPAGLRWRAATQLVPAGEWTFTAPDLQYFMDSPTELSDHEVRSWTVTRNGRTDTISIAMHHSGTPAELDAYAELARQVVAQHMAVYGESPGYDHHRYVFIADYLPWASGDGMEHRNSTVISSTGSLARNRMALLGTLSHEFFHAWSVERMRPRGLEPFDFTRANMSDALWFAEGFTNYYGPLMIRRAGLMTDSGYARSLSGSVNAVINSPGRQFFSPAEMSMQAPFVDAARSIDPDNRGNTFISYYTWGSVVGLGLDLTLRTRFQRPLDGFMRLMWQKYGKTERPYTLEDWRRTLGEFTGDTAFASEFYRRYVVGREVPEFDRLLAAAGFLLRPRAPGKAWLGDINLGFDSAGAEVRSYPQIGTPLYEAGVDAGAVVHALDGRPVRSRAQWQAIVDGHQPGDSIPIEFEQRGQVKRTSIRFREDPRLEVVTFEEAGRAVTEEQRVFRSAWLDRAQ